MRGRAFNRAANSSKQGQCAGARIQQNSELTQRMSMCWRAHSNKNENSSKQYQCAGARMQTNRELKHTRIHNNRELKQIRSMRGRAHSNKTRTQTNTIDARPRAFKKVANSIKQCQCAGARIQRNRERKQTMSMRGRAHLKTLRI